MPTSPDTDVVMGDAGENSTESNKSKFTRLYIGQSGPSIWREGMAVASPIVDGLSESLL
jgi:actin-like protein 6A